MHGEGGGHRGDPNLPSLGTFRFRPEADIRSALVSTGNAEPQEFLHSPAFDPPRVAKLAHKFLHPRKVLVEDRDHGRYRVVHKLLVFRLRKCFVPTELASPELLAVARGIVKDDLTDIPFVVAAPLCVALIQ